MKKKKIFILFTGYFGFVPEVLKVLTRFKYNHVSVGLEEDKNTFYSFVKTGFIVEKINRYIKPTREPFPCKLYEIEVKNNVYKKIKKILNDFVKNKKLFQYNKIGVILSLLNIPYRRKYHYFCSQFVAEVLQDSKILKTKKDSRLYFPKDFLKLPNMKLEFEGTHKSFLTYFNIPAYT